MRQESALTESSALLPEGESSSFWDMSLQSRRKKHGSNQLPMNIGHRGFKQKYPENTMESFKGAVAAGVDALETDLHLSQDGIVVISHDASLTRCFGVDKKIIDCDWEYLSTLRTLAPPHARMPRLLDILEYIATPELEHIWILLDIKADNDAAKMMKGIAETVKLAPTGTRPWHERILLGCWTAEFFPLCDKLLPQFPTAIISVNPLIARKYLRRPGVSFNILQKMLQGPLGYRLVEDAHAKQRLVFVWTVNSPTMMRWSIRRGLDGVITDDPETFGRILDSWEASGQHIEERTTFWDYLLLTFFSIIIGSLSWLLQFRQVRRNLQFLMPTIARIMGNLVKESTRTEVKSER